MSGRNNRTIYIPDAIERDYDALKAALKRDGRTISGELRPVLEELLVEMGIWTGGEERP